MRWVCAFLLSAVVLMPCVGTSAHAEANLPLDVGGGLLTGGYLGELRHDWRVGLGGSLFLQHPMRYDLELRLLGSMLWNDGSLTERHPAGDPDLGALPGDRPESFRRASFEGSLLWRIEPWALDNYGVPYLGAGLSTYERVIRYQTETGLHEVNAWDQGFHALAGLRLYRTSGLFLATEFKLHGIDTPAQWTFAYEGSLLVGFLIGS
jgi:opacity protein-like surface antigen